MNPKDRIKAKVEAFDRWARPWAERGRWRGYAYEFLLFGLKQAWACLFGGAMLALLVGTHLAWPAQAPIARYDFLVLAAVALQAGLLATKLERWDEALVILVFHLVGTGMELFKTSHGSWIYPEAGHLRIGGVPLFSGFMYACIGSYIARAWRLFEFRFERFPPLWTVWALAVAAYANFFADHYGIDVRWGLFLASAILFARTWIQFTPNLTPRRMPLVVAALLASLFVWIAENAGTFANAWIYPAQRDGWSLVPLSKLGSWYLLMMLSFALVCLVHRPEAAEPPVRVGRRVPQPSPRPAE